MASTTPWTPMVMSMSRRSLVWVRTSTSTISARTSSAHSLSTNPTDLMSTSPAHVPYTPTDPLPWGERLAELPVQAGELVLVWLGQSGFFLKTAAGLKLVIDPFLS